MTDWLRAALRETWRLVAGVTRRPVETYEKIARVPSPRGAVVFIGGLALVAAGASAAVAIAAGSGPARAAAGFVLWGPVGVFGVYLGASAVIWLVGRALGSQATFEAFLTAWAGSYVPTAAWFSGLTLFHALFVPSGFLDPSAVGGVAGPVVVQVVFLAFSVAAFLWKALLLYLTLRVVGGLDFRRIVAAAAILAPVAIGYWLLGLSLGWFKVPFI